jgi:hypothetical protein
LGSESGSGLEQSGLEGSGLVGSGLGGSGPVAGGPAVLEDVDEPGPAIDPTLAGAPAELMVGSLGEVRPRVGAADPERG